MSVQRTTGAIAIDATNFQRTDRGVTWAIAVRDLGDAQSVFVTIRSMDGVWRPDQIMASAIDDSFDLKSREDGFTVANWFKTTLLPKLNAWLAIRFPPLANPIPTQPADALEAAHDMIRARLVITVNPDGTLTAGG